MKGILASLLVLILWINEACASPWPVEASIGYVEELQLACAKLQPKKKMAFQSRKEFLFSEAPDVVSKVVESKDYDKIRSWARDEIARNNKKDVIDQCESFLVNSDLALHQKYPPDLKAVPVKK